MHFAGEANFLETSECMFAVIHSFSALCVTYLFSNRKNQLQKICDQQPPAATL